MKINPFLNAVESLKSSGLSSDSGKFNEELNSIMGAMESASKKQSVSASSQTGPSNSGGSAGKQETLLSDNEIEQGQIQGSPSEAESAPDNGETTSLLAVDEEAKTSGLESSTVDPNKKMPSLGSEYETAGQTGNSVISEGAKPQETAIIAQAATESVQQQRRSSPGQLAESESKSFLSKVESKPISIKKPLTPLPDGLKGAHSFQERLESPIELIDSSRSFSGSLQAAKSAGHNPATQIGSLSQSDEFDIQSLTKKGNLGGELSKSEGSQKPDQAKLIEKIESIIKQLDSKTGLSGVTKFVLPNGSEMSLKADSANQSMSLSILLSNKMGEVSAAEVFAQVSKVAESAGITLSSFDFNGQRFEHKDQPGSQAWQQQQRENHEKRPSRDNPNEGLKEMNASAPALNPKSAVSHFA